MTRDQANSGGAWWWRDVYGLCPVRIWRWADAGLLRPGMSGGAGYPWRWPASEVRAALALAAWAEQSGRQRFRLLAAAVAEAGRDNEPGTIVEVRSPSPLVVHYVKVPAVECVHLGGDR